LPATMKNFFSSHSIDFLIHTGMSFVYNYLNGIDFILQISEMSKDK